MCKGDKSDQSNRNEVKKIDKRIKKLKINVEKRLAIDYIEPGGGGGGGEKHNTAIEEKEIIKEIFQKQKKGKWPQYRRNLMVAS